MLSLPLTVRVHLAGHPALWLTILAALAVGKLEAQTTVSGEASGTWGIDRSPYVAIADVTIPADQTLTIEPGVEVVLGEAVAVRVRGQLSAVGTAEAPIVFTAPSEGVFWDRISITNSGVVHHLQHVHVRGAEVGIHLMIGPRDGRTLEANLDDLTFVDIRSEAVLAESEGGVRIRMNGCDVYRPAVDVRVRRGRFERVGSGVVVLAQGIRGSCGVRPFDVPAFGSATVANSTFEDVEGAAFDVRSNSRTGASEAQFVNNVVVGAHRGVVARSPYDVTVRNTLFVRNGVGVAKEDPATTLSTQVTHNGFFQSDSTHFAGYPATFGSVVTTNRNGDPSDLASNIFIDPQIDPNDLRPLAGSPAIDAGAPDSAYHDVCFPPSLGTQWNDLGAFGGPDACVPVGVSGVAAEEPSNGLPNRPSLSQNYPNPFNPATTIAFDLPRPAAVALVVYDALGRAVTTLAAGHFTAGRHERTWNAAGFPSGVYVYRLEAGPFSEARALILQK